MTWCVWEDPQARPARCLYCRRTLARAARRQCQALAITGGETCPMTRIVTTLTPHGVERLERCRQARCNMMQPVTRQCCGLAGQVVCVGQSSQRIGSGEREWMEAWVELLNGEKECPFWPHPNGHASGSTPDPAD